MAVITRDLASLMFVAAELFWRISGFPDALKPGPSTLKVWRSTPLPPALPFVTTQAAKFLVAFIQFNACCPSELVQCNVFLCSMMSVRKFGDVTSRRL